MENDITKQIMEMLNIHLVHCFKKSGIRMDDKFLGEIVVLKDGAPKLESSFLGVYELPSETDLEGRIIMHIDAISDYANAIGKDFLDITTKIFFSLLYNYISCTKKGTVDVLKAEVFANKICKKLLQQKIISSLPPVFYIDHDDKKMHYQILLRQEWMKAWTNMTLEEMSDEYFEITEEEDDEE